MKQAGKGLFITKNKWNDTYIGIKNEEKFAFVTVQSFIIYNVVIMFNIFYSGKRSCKPSVWRPNYNSKPSVVSRVCMAIRYYSWGGGGEYRRTSYTPPTLKF